MIDEMLFNSQKTWNTIAKSFDKTRKKPWPECIEFIQQLSPSSIAADLGCGNGRHFIPLSKHCKKAIGIDLSDQLLKLTESKIKTHQLSNTSLIQASLTDIPLQNKSMDSIICIATIHNIPSRSKRRKALKETFRIMNINGTALFSVWSQEQEKFRDEIQKYTPEQGYEKGDIIIWWKQDNLNIPRFYHLYEKQEFIEDLHTSGFHITQLSETYIASKQFPDNYFAYVEKK